MKEAPHYNCDCEECWPFLDPVLPENEAGIPTDWLLKYGKRPQPWYPK